MLTEVNRSRSQASRGQPRSAGRGTKRPAKSISTAHKQALMAGRDETRAVRRYLEALDAHRPKPGRKRSPESIARRIAAIDAQLAAAEPLTKVLLVQERMDLYSQLKASDARADLVELEEGFISAAAAYSSRKGISYAAWRAVGVDAGVLKRAGIARTP